MAKINRCEHTGLRWHIHSRSRTDIPREAILSIDVSLNNAFCSGDYFRCTAFALIADFHRVEISLGDTLLRHNIPTQALGNTETEEKAARENGRKLGDVWLHENKNTLDEIIQHRPLNVVRWSKWENNPSIKRLKEHYRNLTESYDELRTALTEDVNRLLSSAEKRGKPLKSSRLPDYVFEELAVYHFQAQEKLYFHAYVGSELKLIRALRRHESTPIPLKFHDFLYLDVRQ